jgi:hypothetical protein
VTTPRLHASSLCAIAGWAVVWSAGCGDVVAQPIGESADGAADDAADVAPGPDAPTSLEGGFLQDASAFCQGHGPIPLSGDAGTRCTADLSHLFRFALCACQSLDASGTLTTDSFNLSSEAGAGNVHSASIASNGEVSTNAHTTIGGSIYAAGQNIGAVPAVTLRGDGTILGDVQASGDVHVGGPYQVDHDVDTSGNVVLDTGGSLSVLGQVNLPAGNSATGVSAVSGIHSAAVSVAPPCDCSNPIDVASIVAAHQADNDNAGRLSPGDLVQPSAPVALPCGRYYVNSIQGGTVALEITGRVALFVQGDLTVTGGLDIRLSPGAELDLFVSGNVLLMGMATFGAPNSPAHVRLYVGGTSFELAASVNVGLNAYAPNAVVALASSFEMWGALFAKALQFSGNFAIHYDSSVLTAEGCAPSGGTCKTCDDCAGATPACKSGTCVACVTTADCCAPLVCNAGRCVLAAQ